MLTRRQVYFVSRARVNIAKKQFNHVNNEYEIAFENNTEIEAVSQSFGFSPPRSGPRLIMQCDDDSVPQVKYNFKGIGDLGDLQKDEMTGMSS